MSEPLVVRKVKKTAKAVAAPPNINENEQINIFLNNCKKSPNRGQLYDFLRTFDGNLKTLLVRKNDDGFEWMESILWIFSLLDCIPKFKNYRYDFGNYDKKEIGTNCSIDFPLFFSKKAHRIGDSADVIMINKNNCIIGSSKNQEKILAKTLDIQDIQTISQSEKYNNYRVKIALIVPKKETVSNLLPKKIEKYTPIHVEIQKIIDDQLVIDYDYLTNICYPIFKEKFSDKNVERLIKDYLLGKPKLIQRPHGEYTISKTLSLLKEKNNVLWGHICRSGKSYIMAGMIDEYAKMRGQTKIFLIMTTSPTSTIDQYLNVFYSFSNFADFNIVHLENENREINPIIEGKCNVLIASLQFLRWKINEEEREIKWLKDLKISLRFIDETHNGGTTDKSNKTMDCYGGDEIDLEILSTYGSKSVKTIFMTATFDKPKDKFNIPVENCIFWGLKEISLCKNFTQENRQILYESVGSLGVKAFEKKTKEEIETIYSNFPDLCLLTLNIKNDIIRLIDEDPYYQSKGLSLTALMKIKSSGNKSLNPRFEVMGTPDEETLANYWKMLEEKFNETQRIAHSKGSRVFTKNNGLAILCFIPGGLPGMTFADVSRTLQIFLREKHIFQNFEFADICTVGSKESSLDIIAKARKRAHLVKDGVLILAGDRLKEGASLSFVDVVMLLGNTQSMSDIFQRLFRSCTESSQEEEFKKIGFGIIPNVNTATKIVHEFAEKSFPDKTIGDAIKTILETNVLSLNLNEWDNFFETSFDKGQYVLSTYESIYNAQTKYNPFENMKKVMKQLDINSGMFLKEDWRRLVDLVKHISLEDNDEQTHDLIPIIIDGPKNGPNFPSGVEETTDENTQNNQDGEDTDDEAENEIIVDDENEKNSRVMQCFESIIPLFCLFTIMFPVDTLEGMYDILCLESNQNLLVIILSQLSIIWKNDNEDNKRILDNLIDIMRNNANERIKESVKKIKQAFLHSGKDPKELSKSIDVYLKATNSEKKKHAEFTTPFILRRDMLSILPKEYWKNKNLKIFEPCAGKGQFLIDVIDLLMEGLKDVIKNKEKRYEHIVNNMLYFADINPVNIWIINHLIQMPNPQKQYPKGLGLGQVQPTYNLNCYLGDTLMFDPKKYWKIDGFDLVLGNPPFNISGQTRSGNTLFQEFITHALNDWLKVGGFLLYVHPPAWRKPVSDRARNRGLYELMTSENQMHYLEIHDALDGRKLFDADTRYDWYLIEKLSPLKKISIKNTLVNTFVGAPNGKEESINLSSFPWLPNRDFKFIKSILAGPGEDKVEVIHGYDYESRRKKDGIPIMSETKTPIYKYECIHSTPQATKKNPKGVRSLWSSQRGEEATKYLVPKVIFGVASIESAFIDNEGKYCLTPEAIGITDTKKNLPKILKAIKSEKFKKLKESMNWSQFRFEKEGLRDMKKNFYDYF